MLAFDEEGQPLKLRWNPLDSGRAPAYLHEYADDTAIAPGATDDTRGGWSLDLSGDPNTEKAAWFLYCDKTVTFADGTVWENPAYAAWLETYCGREAGPSALAGYYPHAEITG